VIILGINNMHDASAALLMDGKIVAAAEEERFSRIKHTKGFPQNAVRFCLDFAGLTISEVDLICASWKPWVLRVRAAQALKSALYSPDLFKAKASRGMGQMQREWAELFRLRSIFERQFGRGRYRVEYVDHHLSHAAAAFLCSPFENAAILTIDGAGEADTTALWMGEGTTIRKLDSIGLPHSIGQFYSAVTAFLGFKIQSDEYKVMGLAAMGDPVHADYLRRNVIKLLPNGLFEVDSYFVDYHLARKGLFRETTRRVFGEPRKRVEKVEKRHADIAASAQVVAEEAIFHLLNHLHSITGLDSLTMAGGVAFNCVANGKIFKKTPFRQLFIQPAAGDAGAALGAALHAHYRYVGAPRDYVMKDAYLGPSYRLDECRAALEEKGLLYEVLEDSELFGRTAQALADGKLVCWFQGRLEWGPRALGSRSLLADPRRREMKDIINEKIKQREPFRPFAPSVLSEEAANYFEYYHESPYMLMTFPVKRDMAAKVPAVVHEDYTARPQAVFEETNPKYYRLIQKFYSITGVPMVLNTSFNVQEPIVCTPRDAVATFLKTRADLLVMENLIAVLP
jgi:carbamoyltransferase